LIRVSEIQLCVCKQRIGAGQFQRTRGNTAERGPAQTDDTRRGALQLGQITFMRRHEGGKQSTLTFDLQ